jgi:hypothetical protein
MRIETAKNNQAEKKESVNNFKTENSVFSTNQLKSVEVAPAPTTSAFSKILEETRKQNSKEGSPNAKAESSEHSSKTSKSDDETNSVRHADDQKELDERNQKDGSGDGQTDDDSQAAALALAAMQLETKSVSDTSVPAARAILHVADLERIVSSVRTESFQNTRQLTIALKNSVLQGLEIRLSITESGKLKAEFLALNEQIKKQIDMRKKELSDILQNRASIFSEVVVTTNPQPEKKDS